MVNQNVKVKLETWDVELKTVVKCLPEDKVKIGDKVIIDGLDSVVVEVGD